MQIIKVKIKIVLLISSLFKTKIAAVKNHPLRLLKSFRCLYDVHNSSGMKSITIRMCERIQIQKIPYEE